MVGIRHPCPYCRLSDLGWISTWDSRYSAVGCIQWGIKARNICLGLQAEVYMFVNIPSSPGEYRKWHLEGKPFMSPSCFRNKNSRNILTVFLWGHFLDGKFKKTRFHFMKVNDDLFCVLSPGTYSKVLTQYKVIKFIQSTTSEATLSYFPLDTSTV